MSQRQSRSITQSNRHTVTRTVIVNQPTRIFTWPLIRPKGEPVVFRWHIDATSRPSLWRRVLNFLARR